MRNTHRVNFRLTPCSSVSHLQDSRRRVKLEKKEPLVESQLFIMELARELNKICQVAPPPLPLNCVTDKIKALPLCYLHRSGRTSSATSGPARTSGRPAPVGISSWSGLPCWRRECRCVGVCTMFRLVCFDNYTASTSRAGTKGTLRIYINTRVLVINIHQQCEFDS